MVSAGDAALTIIVATLGGGGTAFITSWVARPKTRADAAATSVAADVAVSADARAWADMFAERAKEAEDRAKRAEEKAENCGRAVDRLEDRMNLLVQHTLACQAEIARIGGTIPPLPLGLTIP